MMYLQPLACLNSCKDQMAPVERTCLAVAGVWHQRPLLEAIDRPVFSSILIFKAAGSISIKSAGPQKCSTTSSNLIGSPSRPAANLAMSMSAIPNDDPFGVSPGSS